MRDFRAGQVFWTLLSACLLLNGQAMAQIVQQGTPTNLGPEPKAEARLEPKSNSATQGAVDFEETVDGMRVTYSIDGLKPSSKHGFHIHTLGDCLAPDARSAGKHFVLVAKKNGTSKDSPDQYAGDMPELQANEDGKAIGTFLMPRLTFKGPFSVIGRSVIVQASADDVTKKSAAQSHAG